MPIARRPLTAALHLGLNALLLACSAAWAAPADKPAKPQPAAAGATQTTSRTASLPAQGLFVGDQLTEKARAKLTDLILEMVGRRVEVVLVVPVGAWSIDGSGPDEYKLTPARLESARRFLSERGVDPRRIFVESRIDAKIKQPRLDVQMIASPAHD